MKKLQDTADLFEVSFPEYRQLRQCRSDIILVKAVWDMVIFVKVRMTISICIFLLHTNVPQPPELLGVTYRKSNFAALCCFCDSQI